MNALSDGYLGGRYVVRHNFLQNVSVQGHGTEGAGTARGQRAVEVYDNIISVIPPYLNTAHGTRSGGALVHDNRFQDLNLVNPPNIFVLANYRETSQRAYTQLGISDGTSIWDANDTDGNGHYVAGNPPHLFASGTVTSPEPTPVLGLGTITDSSKAWTTNRWAGAPWSGPTGIYSIKSTTPTTTSHSLGAYCTANTGTTVTYSYYPASDAGNNPNSGLPAHLLFNVGDQYEIHRVLIEMDQCGRGKADLLYEGTTATAGAQTIPESTITVQGGGTNAFPANPGEIYVGPYRFNCTGKTSNTFTGCTTGWTSGTIAAGTPVAGTYISGTNQQTFPNSALEPCYSWNNVYNASPTPSPAPGVTPSGTQWGMYTTTPATEVLGTDFFNLGARGWDTTPPSVSSTYVAALNGVAYIGTYVYPHPLTSP
jgi:hypothetical protein